MTSASLCPARPRRSWGTVRPIRTRACPLGGSEAVDIETLADSHQEISVWSVLRPSAVSSPMPCWLFWSGMVKVAWVPTPSSLATSMVPPCSSMIFFTVAMPRPVPFTFP